MALRKIDSFDIYATAHITEGPWTSSVVGGGAGSITISAANGRRGTQSARMGGFSGTTRTLRRTFDAQATWIVGFAFRSAGIADLAHDILSFVDGATSHLDLVLNTNGTLSVTRNGTVLGTSTIALSNNVYAYLELLITISDTVGVVTLRVNEVTALSLTAQDTRNAGNESADQIWLGNARISFGAGNTPTEDYDDLYICDGTGGAPYNTFLGDSRVDAVYPTSDDLVQWNVSAGTDHFALVDEAQPTGDTDYVQETTVGDTERFGFQDLPALTGATVRAVQVAMYASNPEAGGRNIAATCTSGATSLDGASQALSAYRYLYEIYLQNPNGPADWTQATVNAATFGARVTA